MMLHTTDTPERSSRVRSGQPRLPGRRWGGARRALLALGCLALVGSACSDDTADGGECIGGEGAVAGEPDDHCIAADGSELAPAIGLCVSGGASEMSEGVEEHEHEEGEEEHPILTGREADDDECKYRVRFENTCVAVNQPVTFTLSLTRKFDGMPGTGTTPSNPEVFLADELTHISPSNDISAREGPPGTYEIGPIVFDRSGRWVIRFHYFDNCSDLPEDSPHGHVAFYIDVP